MHVHLRMIGKETFNSVRLMCRKIVQDDMNLFVSGLTGNNVGEKGDELRTGMTLCGLSQDLTALGVKRSVKRQRSVAKVLKPMALGSSCTQRQDRVFAIQRLDGGFFIDREYCCMLG